MVAEGGLQLGRVERVEEGAQGVDGGCATEAGTEDGVEPLAMHADEQADAAGGGRPRGGGPHPGKEQGGGGGGPGPGGGRGGGVFPGGGGARGRAPAAP